MGIIDIGGNWELKQGGAKEMIPAQVPGCVHMDLLAAGRIPDPFYRDNETDLQWIDKSAWTYSRNIDVSLELLTHDRVLLVCEGLDTLASLFLNGKPLAETNNMYRTWKFDVKELLSPGKNILEIEFKSTVGSSAAPRGIPDTDPRSGHRFKQFVRSHFRKEPCNYGWDWGPTFVTCGIWRPISLVAFDTARLADVRVDQKHSKDGAVALDVVVEVERLNQAGLQAKVTISREGKTVQEKAVRLSGDKSKLRLNIPNPEIWWPNNMGEQPLYQVQVDLLANGGVQLDTQTRKIGLRTMMVRRRKDQWGESFEFVVNGAPFFAKGANWIPADVFAARVTREDLYRLVGDAADANMNMLRVWGGGIYEEDAFYDACDEMGICVWQDFMFACATYPTFDVEYMRSIEAEARDNIRRLRHHPSIALWCGNNEIELHFFVGDKWDTHHMTWEDYGLLFDKLLPSLVKELDPGRDYWPGSPHSPHGDRADSGNAAWGDAHLWDVWHGGRPFEWYRTAFHRFVSEFGFQSFPEPKTVRSYTMPEDRNVVTRVMEHHQKCGTGNSTIMGYMLSWFRMPGDFDNLLWLSQILQGLAMKYAVEHWRRNMPRCMGALYWQLNDCWPVASWASIDSLGRWKALQYIAKQFNAPVLVSGLEDLKAEKVEMFVTSDLPEIKSGQVSWKVTDVSGKTLSSGKVQVELPVRKSISCGNIMLTDLLKKYKAHELMIWLTLEVGREAVSDNLVLLAKPKHLDLERPAIQTNVRIKKDGSFSVRLISDKPALWTWLELTNVNAKYSDNFFSLAPRASREIIVRPAEPMSLEDFIRSLRVRSLLDTYREATVARIEEPAAAQIPAVLLQTNSTGSRRRTTRSR